VPLRPLAATLAAGLLVASALLVASPAAADTPDDVALSGDPNVLAVDDGEIWVGTASGGIDKIAADGSTTHLADLGAQVSVLTVAGDYLLVGLASSPVSVARVDRTSGAVVSSTIPGGILGLAGIAAAGSRISIVATTGESFTADLDTMVVVADAVTPGCQAVTLAVVAGSEIVPCIDVNGWRIRMLSDPSGAWTLVSGLPVSHALAGTASGVVHVGAMSGTSVTRYQVSGASVTPLAPLTVPTAPFALATSPDGSRLLVASPFAGQVALVDLVTGAVIGGVSVPAGAPVAFVGDADHVAVARAFDAEVALFAAPRFTLPAAVELTSDEALTITATETGMPGARYTSLRWQTDTGSGWTDVPAATTSTLALPSSAVVDGARYRIVATSALFGEVASAPAVVTVAHSELAATGAESGTLALAATVLMLAGAVLLAARRRTLASR